MYSINAETINEALTCGICQNIVTLPVHANCCEKAKSVGPACLSCVRGYCELNNPPTPRNEAQMKHMTKIVSPATRQVRNVWCDFS